MFMLRAILYMRKICLRLQKYAPWCGPPLLYIYIYMYISLSLSLSIYIYVCTYTYLTTTRYLRKICLMIVCYDY